MSILAKKSLEHGTEFPFDADANGNVELPEDWTYRAARGIISNLFDRVGIKNELIKCDEEVRVEIVDAIAAIILEAHKERASDV